MKAWYPPILFISSIYNSKRAKGTQGTLVNASRITAVVFLFHTSALTKKKNTRPNSFNGSPKCNPLDRLLSELRYWQKIRDHVVDSANQTQSFGKLGKFFVGIETSSVVG